LKQWADYVKTGTDPNGNSSKVYNIISLEVTGTELAKKVKAPRLVREIDWVDNFWNFPGGKGNVVDEKKQEANGHQGSNGNNQEITNDVDMKVDGAKADEPKPNGLTETKPKGKAPSTWPKVQLYCLVSNDEGVNLISDGHERIMDRLARRLCRQLGVLHDTYRIQGVLLHPTY
jgi:F-box/leucine-rich repeat protein 10/11